MCKLHSNAKPFFYKGNNNIICLLIHGFTGSPSEMRPLGKYLNKRGYGVSAPLLSGHGTTPEDMALTDWHNWYDSVEKEYLRLSNKYKQKKIVPIGLSMGGTLVLHLAFYYDFPGIVTLCPGLYLRSKKAYFTPIIQHYKKYEYKKISSNYDNIDQFYYDKIPIKAVTSQLLMIKEVKREIASINSPFLIIQSKKDRTVNPLGAKKIYDTVGSHKKELVWLNKSGHIITLGQERELVFKKIEEFLSKICK